MYIREIHIENIHNFRAGTRSVRLDLTRPDGSLAGWTVFAGRSSEKTASVEATVSRQPRFPQRQTAPSERTLTCPSSPARPVTPRYSLPSSTMPAPTPEETMT